MASQYWQILERVQSVLSLLPEFSGVSFAVRSRPFCSVDHGDVLPFCCVSGTTEGGPELHQPSRAFFLYPVYVTLFTSKGPSVEDATAMQAKYDRREAARRALWKARVFPTQGRADYDPQPAWDFGGLDQQFDVSIQLFTYHNDEACN